jgi:DNA-directed RNA polymerase specialized sigma24 family protein
VQGSALSRVDLLALDESLARLALIDQRKAQVIELRFFGGLSVEETAQVLSVSRPTVILDTRLAKAWLFSRIRGGGHGG